MGQKYAPAEQEVASPKEEPAVAPVTRSAKEEMLSVFSGGRAEQIAEINHSGRQSSCLPPLCGQCEL